jgi:hypothetical protein
VTLISEKYTNSMLKEKGKQNDIRNQFKRYSLASY